MKVVVLRPEPGNTATAVRLEAHGLDVIRLPLFAVAPVGWDAPDPAHFDALLLTSANAVRHAGDTLRALAALPVVAVGEQTATAARDAALNVVLTGNSDGPSAVMQAQAAGLTRLLHLGGRERVALPVAAAVAVYASEAIMPPATHVAALAGTLALLHSQRAARHFARLVDASALDRGSIALAALSDAVAAAAATGPKWRLIRSAPTPSDDALVALAAQIVGNDCAVPRVRAMEDRPMIRRRLVITGRVQNVFYRDWLVEQANGLGVAGWVRNRADNSVEAVVEGPAELVNAIIAKAREGSPASRVIDVAVHEDAPFEQFEGFEKRATV